MKKAFSFALCIFISLIIIFSCNKDDIPDMDFRDEFIGKYEVTETIYCYGLTDPCSSVKDIILTVGYGRTDTTLSVLGRDVYLDSNGYYHTYHYLFHIWGDSIYSNFMNGGQGGGRYEIYKGVKVSDN